mgnify:CR=1 FL=1|jgi:hypothetical protein
MDSTSSKVDVRMSNAVDLDVAGMFLLMAALIWWAFSESWPAWFDAYVNARDVPV